MGTRQAQFEGKEMTVYKKLCCPSPDRVEMRSYDIPALLEDTQVLVRNTHGAEKHGTMQSFLHKYGNKRGAWDAKRLMHTTGEGVVWNYPIPLGNMQVGIVEGIGSGVSRYIPGDRLVFYRGFEPMSVIDEQDGWKLNAGTSWKSATCLDPATFAFTALRDGNVRIGDAVAVFGLGAIGLMTVALAKLSGCHPVIAIEPFQNRRAVAETLGADATIDPSGADAGALLREASDWRGMDVVVDFSGSMQAMQAALRGVAFGGTVISGAFPSPHPAGLDLGAEAHMNRPQIVFSRTESDPNRDHPRWNNSRVRATVHRMILAGLIDGEAVVNPVVAFDDRLPETYETTIADAASSIKMGIEH